jgi:hypothetical protein
MASLTTPLEQQVANAKKAYKDADDADADNTMELYDCYQELKQKMLEQDTNEVSVAAGAQWANDDKSDDKSVDPDTAPGPVWQYGNDSKWILDGTSYTGSFTKDGEHYIWADTTGNRWENMKYDGEKFTSSVPGQVFIPRAGGGMTCGTYQWSLQPIVSTAVATKNETALSSTDLVGIFSVGCVDKSHCVRLDIGWGSVQNECDASHVSWATQLYLRRLDGPNEGRVWTHHKVGIFASKDRPVRLDVGSGSMKNECDANHESWATQLYIRPVDGSSEIHYNQLVGIFSKENEKRLDIGSASVKKECDASHESWATQFVIVHVPNPFP